VDWVKGRVGAVRRGVRTNRFIGRAPVVATLAAGILMFSSSSASASFTPAQETQMRQAVEAGSALLGYPGIVAGVWQDGVGSFEAAVGVADRASGRPLALDDRFRIGSITKTFTATLVLQLVERGRLGLSDRLSEYVPGVPLGARITIRELLEMTSGIHNYITPRFIANQMYRNPHRTWRPAELVGRAVALKRDFPPGRGWHYSNSNYILLGKVIRHLTDKPLAKLYERRIFEPLGMDETSFDPRTRPRGPLAHGYIRRASRILDTTDWSLSYGWTAGAATSTLADLRRWGPALATGQGVLSARMQRKRLAPLEHGVTKRNGYGLGITLLDTPLADLGEFLAPDGVVPGYDSLVAHSPSSGITVAALGSTSAENNPLTRSPLDRLALAAVAYGLLEPLSAD
jgi:D-alanyl-D-alanine carboxypeptidase